MDYPRDVLYNNISRAACALRFRYTEFDQYTRQQMTESLSILKGFSFGAAILRLVLAMLCGGAVGYGRSKKERSAGLRTYMLISIGAAMAVMLGLYQYDMLTGQWKEITDQVGLKFDAARLAAQSITGIGFLGAGTIIVTKKMTIKGLTTAAGLWTTGIIGLAVGSGYYELGFIGTVLVLLAESVFGTIGMMIRHQPDYHVEIQYSDKTSLDNVLRYCKDNHMDIVNLRIHSGVENDSAEYTAEVHLRGTVKCDQLINHLQRMPGIISAVGV